MGIDQMNFLSWLFGSYWTRKRRHTASKKHFVKIGYIVHDSETEDCNGTPRKIFMSMKNSHGYARRLSKRERRTIFVYEVDLNYYSLGTGDTPGMPGSCRYGVFRGWSFKGHLCKILNVWQFSRIATFILKTL